MNLLTEIRKMSGFSQYKLAEYLDVSRSLISMAENELRDLPRAAFQKAIDMHNELLNDNEKKKKIPLTEKDEMALKEFKTYHQRKMKDCQFRAKQLQRHLDKIQEQHQQAETRLKLVTGLAKTKAAKEDEFESQWLEYHDKKTKKHISKKGSGVQMLKISIEVQLGYAAVHEKILSAFF